MYTSITSITKKIITLIVLAIFMVLTRVDQVHAQHVDYEQLIQKSLKAKDTTGAMGYILAKLKGSDPKTTGPMDWMGTNNQIFNYIFKYSRSKADLTTSIQYMEKLLMLEPTAYPDMKMLRANFLDTYANLLYKLGKAREAMQWELQALYGASNEQKDEFSGNLQKMKQGFKTWP